MEPSLVPAPDRRRRVRRLAPPAPDRDRCQEVGDLINGTGIGLTRFARLLAQYVLVVVFALALGACGSSSPSRSSSAGPRLTIANFEFSPTPLVVQPGAAISVTNRDDTAHTVTSSRGDAFDTGLIAPLGTVTFTAPKTAGTYSYICTVHPKMKGVLVVR